MSGGGGARSAPAALVIPLVIAVGGARSAPAALVIPLVIAVGGARSAPAALVIPLVIAVGGARSAPAALVIPLVIAVGGARSAPAASLLSAAGPPARSARRGGPASRGDCARQAQVCRVLCGAVVSQRRRYAI
jgi:hypothetical protein